LSSYPLYCSPTAHPRRLHSFPTRRSSDLLIEGTACGDRESPGSAREAPLSLFPGRAWIRVFLCRYQAKRIPLPGTATPGNPAGRSEEHTSELQSQSNLVCRLLLEKKNKKR